MAKRRGERPRQGDEGKKESTRSVRVRLAWFPLLGKLAAKRHTKISEEVNRAILELLRAEKLWPPEEGG
jgi:hypothetical protein